MNSQAKKHRNKSNGFTLIELMITIAILGILLSIASNGYSQYIVKANREDAKLLLSGAVLRLERCFTLEGSYNGACSLRTSSEDGLYTLTATREVQSYTLTATPEKGGRQSKDAECATFTITSTGDKSATGSLGARCW